MTAWNWAYSRPMFTGSRHSPAICLLVLMLVVMRTAGVHAHLCHDGTEPPASFHLADGGDHPCEIGNSAPHSGDRNVQLGADILLKSATQADPWLPAASLFVGNLFPAMVEVRLGIEMHQSRVATTTFLRPPLRGPPA